MKTVSFSFAIANRLNGAGMLGPGVVKPFEEMNWLKKNDYTKFYVHFIAQTTSYYFLELPLYIVLPYKILISLCKYTILSSKVVMPCSKTANLILLLPIMKLQKCKCLFW